MDKPDQRPIPGAVALLEVLTDNPFALDEAVAAVRRYGLVKASQRTLVMHRLVQQIIRDQLDPATRAARAAIALRLIRVAFPTEHTDPDAWPAHAWLLPHVLAVTGHADVPTVEPEAAAWLLNEAGLYLWQRADYQQARSLLERALAIDEAHLGADHPTTASVLNNLANVLADQGDLERARTMFERALAIRRMLRGSWRAQAFTFPEPNVAAHPTRAVANETARRPRAADPLRARFPTWTVIALRALAALVIGVLGWPRYRIADGRLYGVPPRGMQLSCRHRSSIRSATASRSMHTASRWHGARGYGRPRPGAAGAMLLPG